MHLPPWMSTQRIFSKSTTEVQENRFRNAFEHDIGILLHSSVFRRLSHKTQVYINPKSDFVRSRLTHSLECQQIGRELGRRFGFLIFKYGIHIREFKSTHELISEPEFISQLESLVGAACIAHDMGHPPFGHPGAEALDKASEHSGIGFDDNRQTLRHFFREDRPLNVTVALADAVMKYKDPVAFPDKAPAWYTCDAELATYVTRSTQTHFNRHPACYLMEAADDISYLCGDLEDALKFQLMSTSDLQQLVGDLPYVTFSKTSKDWVLSEKTFSEVFFTPSLPQQNLHQSVCSAMLKLMMYQVHSVLECFTRDTPASLAEIPTVLQKEPGFTKGILYAHGALKSLGTDLLKLKKRFYNDILLQHRLVTEERQMVNQVIPGLWQSLASLAEHTAPAHLMEDKNFKILPADKQQHILSLSAVSDKSARKAAVLRFLTDYISGMTDRYAIEIFDKLKST